MGKNLPQLTKNRLIKYACEALGLGVFMFSAGLFDILIDHPDFPIRSLIESPIIRRFLIGLSMGLTALFIIFSPFGQKSKAHINPSVTLTFWRLNRIKGFDAIFYIIFQFIGGALGLFLISLLFPQSIEHPVINYIVTIPSKSGKILAFFTEFLISFVLMLTVLWTNKNHKLSKYAPYFTATLITLFITFEAPFSGMSMNPARTFSSAIVANIWTGFWIYCTAPILGMLLAGEIYLKKD
ncbi:MAG: aquaporin [Bacteroidota bacterium]